mmetsp:Transcript_13408/g.18431  ORF Transcript_13408/g.18431 Transcript_13408/m.18431 type:complete len:100 (-) Transcript_13408:472-771(-)
MKAVYDAAHSPRSGDIIPTHLYPYCSGGNNNARASGGGGDGNCDGGGCNSGGGGCGTPSSKNHRNNNDNKRIVSPSERRVTHKPASILLLSPSRAKRDT